MFNVVCKRLKVVNGTHVAELQNKGIVMRFKFTNYDTLPRFKFRVSFQAIHSKLEEIPKHSNMLR